MITDKPVFEFQVRDQSAVPTIERWAVMEKAEGLKGEFTELKPLLEAAPAAYPAQEKDPEELVGIFYTSGTTASQRVR